MKPTDGNDRRRDWTVIRPSDGRKADGVSYLGRMNDGRGHSKDNDLRQTKGPGLRQTRKEMRTDRQTADRRMVKKKRKGMDER